MIGPVRPALRRRSAGLAAAWLLAAAALAATPAAAQDPTAKEVVEAMIRAHGGMEAWKDAPTVSFTDTWFTPSGESRGSTRVTVEQGRRRAVLDAVDDSSHIVWDGEKAWSEHYAGGAPPRFKALLDYYFLNLPWLAEDPGVILGPPGRATLWDDPTEYTTVRVTYEPGTGDTPDDYYLLYIDPETHRLAGCEYIVTYASLLPEGVTHTPPHVLLYDGFTQVNGLLVPAGFTIYLEDHTVYARCTVSDWSFSKPFDASGMEMPADAVLDTSAPTRKRD